MYGSLLPEQPATVELLLQTNVSGSKTDPGAGHFYILLI